MKKVSEYLNRHVFVIFILTLVSFISNVHLIYLFMGGKFEKANLGEIE